MSESESFLSSKKELSKPTKQEPPIRAEERYPEDTQTKLATPSQEPEE